MTGKRLVTRLETWRFNLRTYSPYTEFNPYLSRTRNASNNEIECGGNMERPMNNQKRHQNSVLCWGRDSTDGQGFIASMSFCQNPGYRGLGEGILLPLV